MSCIVKILRMVVSQEAQAKYTKRKRGPIPFEENKRSRTRRSVALEDAKKLEFQRTSGLSSFLRVTEPKTTKVKFEPLEYFDITITSGIAYGATGDTHATTTDFLGSNNKHFSFDDVVVKLAFTDVQRKRLQYEFNIESEALALFMANKTGFLDALKSIHSAGVRHRDLRLENLTIDHEAHPYIIDFNRAALDADEIFLDREDKTFLALLNGEHESRLSHETQEPDAESDGS
ncbi:hypothetical protein E4T56_gene18216 [Termitomyces sp. T112]|nr:hypothetical protein E4T56_gene18216 [Termitomyces sp. T112]